MNNHSLVCAAVAAMLTITSNSVLAASDAEWFGAVRASLAEASFEDTDAHNSIGTGEIINGRLDGRLKESAPNDYSAALSIAAGRRMGNWLMEGEYTYRYRTDWDVSASTDSIQTITNVFTNVESHALMFNLARRGVLTQYWSWEVGAGLGFIRHKLDGAYKERAVPGVRAAVRIDEDDTDSSFTYSAFAGVVRELRGAWSLNIRYRYLDMGEVEISGFGDRTARLSADLIGHEIQFSLERDL